MPEEGNPTTREYVGPVNLGLFTDRSPLFIPKGGLQDCLNVRIRRGALTNEAIGWSDFGVTLDGEVTLCDSFEHAGGIETFFGTRTSLYRYEALAGETFLNPTYTTGTASRAGTAVTGIGTIWNNGATHTSWLRAVLPGDFIHFGTAGEDDPAAVWHEIATVTGATTLTTVTTGAVVAGPYTIRKKMSGADDEVWQWVLFPRRDTDGLDYWIGTNGFEMFWWNTANPTAVHFDPGFIARTLGINSRVLVGADISEPITFARIPGKVRTSAIGDPLNFLTLEATELFATEGQEQIRCVRTLGDFLSLYCEDSVRTMAFVGPPVYWAFRIALPSIGIVGRNAIAEFGDHHEFMARDAIYAFDGVRTESLAFHALRGFLPSMDFARLNFQVLTAFDEENGEVTWIIPQTTDVAGPEIGLVEHYLEEQGTGGHLPFTKRNLPATAAGNYIVDNAKRFSDFGGAFNQAGAARFNDRELSGAYPALLFGGPSGVIYLLNDGQAAAGATLPCFAEFATRPAFGDGFHSGLIKRIEPGLGSSGVGNLFVEIIKYDRIGSPGLVVASIPYDIAGSGRRFVSPRQTARYAAVRFRSDGSAVWPLEAWAWNVARASG
jgi:hypothetical protein